MFQFLGLAIVLYFGAKAVHQLLNRDAIELERKEKYLENMEGTGTEKYFKATEIIEADIERLTKESAGQKNKGSLKVHSSLIIDHKEALALLKGVNNTYNRLSEKFKHESVDVRLSIAQDYRDFMLHYKSYYEAIIVGVNIELYISDEVMFEEILKRFDKLLKQ